ncbi:MAG: hypothetical protein Q9216_000156 [Gyalolechia sp. 2 TL-2023]
MTAMNNFVPDKEQSLMMVAAECDQTSEPCESAEQMEDENDSTDLKLATLASLFPSVDQMRLLNILIASDGSVEQAQEALAALAVKPPRKRPAHGIGYQTSLAGFKRSKASSTTKPLAFSQKRQTRKGQTLHLFTPEDIENHTPCSIIHNFLPAETAESLLNELLTEATTFERQTFKLFDNVVQSPHSACFYVDSPDERKRQQTEYLYNGSYLTVRLALHVLSRAAKMRQVSEPVRAAVNQEIARRVRQHYPNGTKLKYQSPDEWIPNAAFVNCYRGPSESVGYHCDQLTYLGPRAVIGSLSLGVAREFCVRKIVARDEPDAKTALAAEQDTERADLEGQIALHLPHNSLLVMHAEMQEEWSVCSTDYCASVILSSLRKHSIKPALVIDPHPIAGNKRINSSQSRSDLLALTLENTSHLPPLPRELSSKIHPSLSM